LLPRGEMFYSSLGVYNLGKQASTNPAALKQQRQIKSMESAIMRQFKKIAGKDAVLDRPEELMLYEYDAGVDKHRPGAVVFAQTTQQVSQVMKLASDKKIPVVPRKVIH